MTVRLPIVLSLCLFGFAALHAPASAQQRAVVHCESIQGRDQYCEVETRYGVRIVEEFSRGRCEEGETWGYDRGRIWVRGGCRAAFELGTGDDRWARDGRSARIVDDGRYERYGDRVDAGGIVLCESKDNRRRHCRADIYDGGVAVVRNISRTPCVEGRNFGWDDRGVWVDHGCRAEFRIIVGRGYGTRDADPPYSRASVDVVRCESHEFRRNFCDVGRARGVELADQTSEAACIEGRTWGYDGRSLWVDRGCAGEFEVVR